MVVSRYIGETEKNLERIFSEAEHSDVVLFFDEADALFGRRSEVKDAHDRHANVEVAYLLQRVESFEGLVILASNLQGNLDEAFLRRITYVVEFTQPEEAERLHIWERAFPGQAPLASDVDFGALARHLRIPGGHIRNIALAAAILAAKEGDEIRMRHISRAAELELHKMGRLSRGGDGLDGLFS
jgi:SpoVK/Ycf46/Vps4 family AAA+-type ATPase